MFLHGKKMITLLTHLDTLARLAPALLGVVPYAGIDLAVYETLKTVSL